MFLLKIDHVARPPEFTDVETENQRNHGLLKVAQCMMEVAVGTVVPGSCLGLFQSLVQLP